MRSRRFLHEGKLLVLMFNVVLCAGCLSGYKMLTKKVEDLDVMTEIVEDHIPLETSVSKARKFLTQERFTCSDQEDYQGSEYRGYDFVFCERRDGGAIIFDRWVVIVIHTEGSVLAVNTDKNTFDVLH